MARRAKVLIFLIILASLMGVRLSLNRLHTGSKARVANEMNAIPHQVRFLVGDLPLSFEPNYGQADPAVRFESRANGFRVFLTDREAVLGLTKDVENPAIRSKIVARGTQSRGPNQKRIGLQRKVNQNDSSPVSSTFVHLNLVGQNPHARMEGEDVLPGKANFFAGSDPARWNTNVPTYAKVRSRSVYPGVDLVFYGQGNHLEFDFVLDRQADPKAIKLKFTGMDRLAIGGSGDLNLILGERKIILNRPKVYQQIAENRQLIPCEFKLTGRNTVGFNLGKYNTAEPLIVDPGLTYSTYLGHGPDVLTAITVDSAGNAYVTGDTIESAFPTTSNAFNTVNQNGQQNVFVTKINPTGTGLVYSTYLAGPAGTLGVGNAIAVDSSGNCYVAGSAGRSFPVTAGAFQTANNANANNGINGFVTKLDPTGSKLVYSTYLGGSYGGDAINALAIDTAGSAYVAGIARSNDFPATPGAFQSAVKTADINYPWAAKLNAAGTALVYSTYLQGNGVFSAFPPLVSQAYGIAIDGSGNAYVVGETTDEAYPVTPGAFQSNFTTDPSNPNKFTQTGFVSKINPTGSNLVYSSYLGGGSEGSANAIATDANGNAYVTGWTANDFLSTPGVFQPQPLGLNAFVTKINPAGSTEIYSTFLGGSCSAGLPGDTGNSIKVDAAGNAYVSGTTCSPDFPLTTEAVQSKLLAASITVFLSKLNPSGTNLLYSTFLGGSGYPGDAGYGVAIDDNGNAYVAGTTTSTDFPVTPGAFQSTGTAGAGVSSGFVSKIVIPSDAQPVVNDFTMTANPTALTVKAGQDVTTTVTVTPLNNFYRLIGFDCSGLPGGSSCSFSPPALSGNWTTTNVILTIHTTANLSSTNRPIAPWTLPLMLLAAAACLLFRSRRLALRIAFSVFLLGVLTLSGCGSPGPNGGGGPAPTVSTPTITASEGVTEGPGIQHSVTLSLTINP